MLLEIQVDVYLDVSLPSILNFIYNFTLVTVKIRSDINWRFIKLIKANYLP